MYKRQDVDFKILNELEDKDLVSYCKLNKAAETLCNDQGFWLNRIRLKFPYLGLNVLNKHKQGSWSEYYIDLRKINLSNNVNQTLIDGAKNGRLDHVIISMNMGADVHTSNDSAVRWASQYGHIDICLLYTSPSPRDRS